MNSINTSSIICCDNPDFNEISLCISNSYNVYSFGFSIHASHDNKEMNNIPTQIKNLTNIIMIDCSYFHTLCLDFNGNIFSFGFNYKGLLGIGKTQNELEFTSIPQQINLTPCKSISCGERFSMCLTEEGHIYSFGCNFNGQLGLDCRKSFSFPQHIPDLDNIEFIICGGIHTICRTKNHVYYAWGYNESGQLGQENKKQCYKPKICKHWPCDIISIKCGYTHSLLLTRSGELYTFGSNHCGHLGINDQNIQDVHHPVLIKDIPEIQRIECGHTHSMCIDINNNLWIFGSNYYGQLGLGDTENRYKPILHPTLSNIIDISSRGSHTFVKTIDNKIYAFGNNIHSQLGIKTSEYNQLIPIQVLEGNEDIWCSTIGKSKQKSARK